MAEKRGHTADVFRVRHAGNTQHILLGKRGGQFGQGMGAVTHPHAPAQAKLTLQRGRQGGNRDKHDFTCIQALLRMSNILRPGQAQRLEGFGAGDAGAVIEHAMYHHRQTDAFEQQRQ
ncbi:hypothetical protein D3C78_1454720 [compost metagenome]